MIEKKTLSTSPKRVEYSFTERKGIYRYILLFNEMESEMEFLILI
jgi:DNA-binding HxlR family transcriptional regulator